MEQPRKSVRRSGFSAAILYAGAAALIAIPSAGLAVGAFKADALGISSGNSFASFTPASVDPRLAQMVAQRASAGGKPMRFTPAGAANRRDRSVTVAVRIGRDATRAIGVRSELVTAKEQVAGSSVRIAPARYNLGVSRGYSSFAQAPGLATRINDAAIPDLASFTPSPGVKSKPSRFKPRIELEELGNAGRAPLTLDSIDEQRVDVGGSYRVTRNLDVTAGVRYSQERDQLAPLINTAQDSQAVYVGTQFRF